MYSLCVSVRAGVPHLLDCVKPQECVDIGQVAAGGGLERLGYLSSRCNLQPKHTFFCLGLGCLYQRCPKTYHQTSYQGKTAHYDGTRIQTRTTHKWGCSKIRKMNVVWMGIWQFWFHTGGCLTWPLSQMYQELTLDLRKFRVDKAEAVGSG